MYLIRGKEGHLVEYQGENYKVREVADQVVLNSAQEVNYKGRTEQLYVGEAEIKITRNAKPAKTDTSGKRIPPQKGIPLDVRLIIVEVRDMDGKTLARWTLLSNVPSEIKMLELAQWYYWRWNIESFFKLLKQAGHDAESWLQTTPQAILRRLLISCMACVLTWRIQRNNDDKNTKVRAFLTRISGRQQKRDRRESAPAILAGLSILFNALQLLSEYSIDDLKNMAEIALGDLHNDV